jgi:hypothetical protein
MMQLDKFWRVLAHVGMAPKGAGVVTAGLDPVACHQRPVALGLTGPAGGEGGRAEA